MFLISHLYSFYKHKAGGMGVAVFSCHIRKAAVLADLLSFEIGK